MSKVTKSSGCVFNDLNVSHHTSCVELETVAYQYKFRDVWLVSDAPKVMRKDDYELRELVTRQNAEEVIAAERAEKEKLEAAWLEAEGKISDLEADNKRLRDALEIIDDHALRCANLVKSDPCARAYVKNILDEARAALEVKP